MVMVRPDRELVHWPARGQLAQAAPKAAVPPAVLGGPDRHRVLAGASHSAGGQVDVEDVFGEPAARSVVTRTRRITGVAESGHAPSSRSDHSDWVNATRKTPTT
jgi:hypothetical protein